MSKRAPNLVDVKVFAAALNNGQPLVLQRVEVIKNHPIQGWITFRDQNGSDLSLNGDMLVGYQMAGTVAVARTMPPIGGKVERKQ